MDKYRVRLTRSITESTYIEVGATDEDSAAAAALDKLWESADTEWVIDDDPLGVGPAYVSRVEFLELGSDALLHEAGALIAKLKGMAIHPNHYAALEAAVEAAKQGGRA